MKNITISLLLIILTLIILIVFQINYKKLNENFTIDNKLDLLQVSNEINKLIPSPVQLGGSGDKGEHHHDYLEYYKNIISRVKSDFKLLEIGISHGYSVVSFCRAYPQSIIYGTDINLTHWNNNKQRFNITPEEYKRLKIINEDATKPEFIKKIPNDFDIILDDGSHRPKDMIKTFELLFKNNLKKGGIYIVEDVHCNMFPFPFIKYVTDLFPFVYKFKNFSECQMLSTRDAIKKRIKLDWRYEIKDITISRDIVIITKENL